MSDERQVTKKNTGAAWHVKRSAKQLESSAAVSAYQKEWFKNSRRRISNGEPFAICNADEAEEIFLVMDIPVIVKQWWSAVISAKRLSPHYFDVLNKKGYDLCSYCNLGLGCTIDGNPERAPWGGLPKPTVIIGSTDCDAGLRITEIWAREYGAHLFPIEQTALINPYPRWWEKIKDHWDQMIEPHRLDLRVEELKSLIRFLEVTTGRTFSLSKLMEVMGLINEQADYFKKARDLIAETVPCPVTLPDQLAIYPTQWQRGTPQGRDLTKLFYEEVKDRVNKGVAAYPDEKLRLMWLGPGLWANTAFYQYFEEKYGAVFVCSIYLSIGADGYARSVLNNDPLRALAGRHVFLGLGDDNWIAKEARRHNVNAVIQMVSQNCRRSLQAPLTRMVLEDSGIPTLAIPCDNVDARAWNENKIKNLVSDFIEKRLLN
jgi:benzoyl-CoA reductase/2-hydroxyglutaryl-CoA dehydratase subunit BcrC/BadD/HgdB